MFLRSIAIVSGPTPPGTGDSAPATLATSGCTSPTTMEPLAAELAVRGQSGHSPRNLLRQIGAALLIRHQLVARAEVTEKPELLWDRPQLERLYMQLMDEFEISERNAQLEAKMNVITDTSRTALDLVRHGSTLRVEWYIVALILVELVLSFVRH